MVKKKKEIKIIRKDSNKEDYTFVSSDNILNNVKDIESAITTHNEKKSDNKFDERFEKKVHSKKVDNKGRKILGKSM
ncbi:MAG TPA: hypothetical protein VF222_06865 [Nitrososphaeraceae archaeon]